MEKLASLNQLLLLNFLLESKKLELVTTNLTRKEAGLILQYIKGNIKNNDKSIDFRQWVKAST